MSLELIEGALVLTITLFAIFVSISIREGIFKSKMTELSEKTDLIVECFNTIEAFNSIAGNLSRSVNPTLEHHMLTEEIQEYLEATLNNDQKGVKDALGDTMVVLWGTISKHELQEEFWSILSKINESNMSKFCKTKEEADETVQKYKSEGIVAYHEYNNEHGVWVVKRHDGKIFKSINFRLPEL